MKKLFSLVLFTVLLSVVVFAVTTFTIVAPVDGENLSGTVTLNVTTAMPAAANATFSFEKNGVIVNFTVNNATADQTVFDNDAFNTATLADGHHNLTVNVTNTSSVSNVTSINITVDNTPPSVNAVATPQNGANVSTGFQLFNVSVNDVTLSVDFVQFNISNGSNPYVASAAFLSGTFYNVSINVSTLAEGTHSVQVKANDTEGNLNDSTTFNITVDRTAPFIHEFTVLNPDRFYSHHIGNHIINLSLNVTDSTGILLVTANFTNVTTACPNQEVNLTYDASLALYTGTCDVQAEALTSEFDGSFVSVSVTDVVGNTNTSVLQNIVLYNMTTPPADPAGCTAFTTGTTNMSQVPVFETTNLYLNMLLFGSSACNGVQLPWGDSYRHVLTINFSSVNLSTQSQAAKMAQLGNAISVDYTGPNQFGDTRIFVNDTLFLELSTQTTLSFYSLPFASVPAVDPDNEGSTITDISWIQGGYDSTFGTFTGNLTFTVANFSGYNASDNVTPTIGFTYPTSGQNISANDPQVNISLNGTGTQISLAVFYIDGQHEANFTNRSINTASCDNVSLGSERFICDFELNSVSDGTHNLSVFAYDYGQAAPGNLAFDSILFTVDTQSPYLATGDIIGNVSTSLNADSTVYYFAANWTDDTTLLDGARLYINGSGAPSNNVPQLLNESGKDAVVVNVASGFVNLSFTVNGYASGSYHMWMAVNDTVNNTNTTAKISVTVNDVSPPGTVTNLHNITRTNTTITWNWTNPSDADLNGTIIYIDDVNIVNLSATAHNYTATGFAQNSTHTITIQTFDTSGNTNDTNVTNVSRSLVTPLETVPPAVVTGLVNSSNTNGSIQINWTNPSDADFNLVKIFLNGANTHNVSSPGVGFNYTNLTQNTAYTFDLQTVDNFGNTNTTNVSVTASTLLSPDVTAPTLTVTAPTTTQVQPSALVNFTVTDDQEISNSTVSATVNGTSYARAVMSCTGNVTRQICVFTATGLPNGVINVSVTAQDVTGNAQTSYGDFSVNDVAPTITVNQPTNNSIIYKGQLLQRVDLTFNERVDANYTLNGTGPTVLCTNCSSVAQNLSMQGYGSKQLLITVTDAAGKTNSSFLNFTFVKDLNGNNINDDTELANGSADTDGDGVNNSDDTLFGNVSSISSNLATVNMTIDGSPQINGSYSGALPVTFQDGNETLVSFTYTFSAGDALDLSDIVIQKQSANDSGSILIKGIDLSSQGQTKTVVMDRLDNTTTGVCIEDQELASISEVSGDCSGANEVKVECDGTSQSGYTCTLINSNTQYQIAGLSHSGVTQIDFTQSTSTTTTSSSGGSSGGSIPVIRATHYESFGWSSTAAGQSRTAVVTNPNIPITTFTWSVTQDLVGADLSIGVYEEGLPSGVDEVSSSNTEGVFTIHTYFELESGPIGPLLDTATLEFEVPQSWLDSQGVSTDNIVLLHFVDDEWEVVEVELVETTSGTHTFRTTFDSLSFFAIAARGGDGTTPTTTTEEVEDETDPSEDAEPVPEAAAEEESPKGNLTFLIVALVIIVLIVIGYFAYQRTQKPKKHKKH